MSYQLFPVFHLDIRGSPTETETQPFADIYLTKIISELLFSHTFGLKARDKNLVPSSSEHLLRCFALKKMQYYNTVNCIRHFSSGS